MLQLTRHHDFQLFLSPENQQVALTNPPSFNWPQPKSELRYNLQLELCGSEQKWQWQTVQSPFQLSFSLPVGDYRWCLTDAEGQQSEWFSFEIDETVAAYLAPTAEDLFTLCENRSQFMMYFDEDISAIRAASEKDYSTLKATAKLAVDCADIKYPDHYKRGAEAGKRTAITNVREWLDRDLMALTLLYKIWQEEDSGQKAVDLLLSFAQWSPEGPATLVRPLTWGDEVGLSLSRNLFLAYHWLSPLMTEPEKSYVRPMLIRIAYQMEERLAGDEFHQFPGHSHTSRLPGYLGVAALVLHKEFERAVCERWLEYSLMIYRGVLPFYGGKDGSWAEGAFYSSSYSKWHHPFFLSVERLSDFSFYEHPFYKNYCHFAMDFVASEQAIHPFGDGFWCKRKSVEWPGFFAQNPLRIYAQRFGEQQTKQVCEKLESQIDTYALHLLDVIPTTKQLAFTKVVKQESKQTLSDVARFYDYAGFGIATFEQTNLSFRASRFGNSSHRHADQGNLALIDNGLGVLTPTGSYGYCFGSAHHSEWTQTTQAHNLPLIAGKGQLIDDESATAEMVFQQQGEGWYCCKINLAKSYQDVESFIRTFVFVAGKGVVIWDSIELQQEGSIQWRLHSHLNAHLDSKLVLLQAEQFQYECALLSQIKVQPTIEFGYQEAIPVTGGIESDATLEVSHLQWELPATKTHNVVVSCLKQPLEISFEDEKLLSLVVTEGNLTIDKSSLQLT
ncbi:heparinase [Psychromonas sp. RZ22]|uniref:heparinase II/III domain-containing protein n=1 Tax=Psychromonas algarum TaxID=2555643 RepID=UPI001067BE02|nr:heparinase II/III family protein [Psychromonas sp. RZ22]TEW54703.1 heparinase [Psychromonas sp. RZ22]